MTIETYQAWRRRVACRKYRAANREKANAAQAAYRRSGNNPRGWEKANPDAMNAIKRKWRKDNPGAVRAFNAARRKRAREQRCDCCTNADIRHLYEVAALVGAEVDHITPLAAGGAHCAKNLQVLSAVDHKKKTRLDATKCKIRFFSLTRVEGT